MAAVGSTDAVPATPSAWLAEVKRFEQDGEFFKAYDIALQGLRAHPADPRLAHRAVLCLCNAGALQLARKRFEEFELDRMDAMECVTLDARILKSTAYRFQGAKRRQLLLAAADRYAQAYAHAVASGADDAYYPGINVATLRLLTGDADAATSIARRILGQLQLLIASPDFEQRGDAYWVLATAIEAHLILGDLEQAKALVGRALRAGGNRYAELASTARQLRLVLAARQMDLSWLGEFAPPEIVHYTGHIIAAPDGSGRLPASAEAQLATRIGAALDGLRIGSAYGSLAAGADILFAEALLARGVSLNVTLPFSVDDFIVQSVAPSGGQWIARFQRCLDRAATVRFATEDQYLGDDQLFAYCSQLAMGLAVLCARHLCATARQLAIWDGEAPVGRAGTAADLAVWQRTGLPQSIIRYGETVAADLSAVAVAPLPVAGRDTRAMLFGDIKGFSKLSDAQIPVFTARVLGEIGRVIDSFSAEVALVNTWGDGLFLVFEDAAAAARCALALQAAMAEIDMLAHGLPATLALRVGGHLGPVYRIDDPVLHRWNFMGAHVSRAARIEPITPEGCVYVTESFAAVLALHHGADFACDYVGVTEMAKAYGPMRMFLLRRASGAGDGPATLRQMQ